jgi:hypothetical protein
MDLPPPPPMESQPYREYDEFFAPISADISTLVTERGLLLKKYYHEAPCWSLLFRHPKGGVAKVEISKKDDGRIGVCGVWWKDDFDAGPRSIMSFDEDVVERSGVAVTGSAQEMLARILAHQSGVWSKVVDGYKPLWHPYGRSFIEDDEKRYPLPKEKEK